MHAGARHWEDPGNPSPGQVVRGDEVGEWLERSRSDDPLIRKRAVQHLCPCHVRAKHDHVWRRIMDLAADPDRSVRSAAIHALGDGSPQEIRDQVIATLERRFHDPDRKLRRVVRKLLAFHRRTGRINIL